MKADACQPDYLVKAEEYTALAELVTALHSARFTSRLIAWLHDAIPFDCAVILGYRESKHPIYLFDSIKKHRELLFQRYLTDSFLSDPFYLAIQRDGREGVFSLKGVSKSTAEYKHYQQEFYAQTGWKDELCLSVKLDNTRWVVVYLGVINSPSFRAEDIAALTLRFELLRSLCHQHWGQAPFTLAEAYESKTHIRQAVTQALASFGAASLTPREQEVTALLVQGYDSKEIAEQLKIGIGTVKNHRKRVYAQLNVASLSELFQLFLSHLMVSD